MMPSMDDEETDDLSTCAVCFSEFDDNVNRAKFLSCAHTFCLECLKSISKNAGNQSVACPTCRNITSCPGGVISLPNNPYVAHIVKMKMNKAQNGTTPPMSTEKSWCLLCNSLSKDACLESTSPHIIISMGKSSNKDAQELTKQFNTMKEQKAMTANSLNQLQSHLNSVLLSLKIVEDKLKCQVEQNDIQLAEIASSLDHPDVLELENQTVSSLKDKVGEAARKSEAEQVAATNALAEFEAQFKTRILLHLQDVDTKAAIRTLPLFEEGFVPSGVEDSDSLNRTLSVLSYIVFSTLSDKNVSIQPGQAEAAAVVPAVVPAAAQPSSPVVVAESGKQPLPAVAPRKAPKERTVVAPRPSSPAAHRAQQEPTVTASPKKNEQGPAVVAIPPRPVPVNCFVLGQSIFTFKFKLQGKMIGSEVRVVPTPGFDQTFLAKMGNSCYRKPTNYVTDLSKAFANGFVKVDFTSRIPSTEAVDLQLSSQRTADQAYEVGIVTASLDSEKNTVHSAEFVFLLPQFRSRCTEVALHFGKVVQGHQVLNDLSLMKKQIREGMSTIIEAV